MRMLCCTDRIRTPASAYFRAGFLILARNSVAKSLKIEEDLFDIITPLLIVTPMMIKGKKQDNGRADGIKLIGAIGNVGEKALS